jgi:hypothetical protein
VIVRPGAERSNTAPIWPSKLVRPSDRLVYLDLNQWITLAKANTGHRDGVRWRDALGTVRAERTGWTFVIGMSLIMELTGIRRRAQRAALGAIIEELSQYSCVVPLTVIAALEFDASLAAATSADERFSPVPLLGNGVMRACGTDGALRIRDQAGNDVTAQARLQAKVTPEEFDRRLAEAELQLNRSIICGPADDDEEQSLRADGWDPSVARRSAERRARQEREQAERLDRDSRWRRGRLRDIVTARYLALEIEEIRQEAVEARGVDFAGVLSSVAKAREFADSMPAGDVWITLVTAKHRNAHSIWKPNDMFDIDALSVAAAYCDVVVTERHAAHVLKSAGIEKRYDTAVLTDVDQLAGHLRGSAD